MKKLIVFIMLVPILISGGCKVLGVLAVPTRSERKVPAEYALGREKGRKILVFVKQPVWVGAQANLRYHLTRAMNRGLTDKVKIANENLIGYEELADFRAGRGDFSQLSPVEVGKALGADVVLLVVVEDYHLSMTPEERYYRGGLSTKSVIFDTASGKKVWPQVKSSKSVRVGFEVEQRGQEIAIKRLMGSSAYCTVRYFYNCVVDKFKIGDDRTHIGWGE